MYRIRMQYTMSYNIYVHALYMYVQEQKSHVRIYRDLFRGRGAQWLISPPRISEVYIKNSTKVPELCMSNFPLLKNQ